MHVPQTSAIDDHISPDYQEKSSMKVLYQPLWNAVHPHFFSIDYSLEDSRILEITIQHSLPSSNSLPVHEMTCWHLQ